MVTVVASRRLETLEAPRVGYGRTVSQGKAKLIVAVGVRQATQAGPFNTSSVGRGHAPADAGVLGQRRPVERHRRLAELARIDRELRQIERAALGGRQRGGHLRLDVGDGAGGGHVERRRPARRRVGGDRGRSGPPGRGEQARPGVDPLRRCCCCRRRRVCSP